MRALVTGGAGFIGGHLCQRLLDEGFDLLCLDNFFTGRRSTVEALSKNPRFSWREHDVIQPLPEEKFDRIYLLACPASPPHYQRDPLFTLHTSWYGAEHALRLAERLGGRVLLASTSEVYGDPLVHPQLESYWGNVNPIGPRSCYDEGKRVAETLLQCYAARGVEARTARIFNTYGPGMQPDDGRVVSNFAVQALAGEPLTLYGDGQQTRSFCYVSDLVEGLFSLMERGDGPNPVNLGNPGEFTVAALADQVIALTGSTAGLRHLPLPKDDPTRRRPDISRARALLGWEPRVPLSEGLPRTIEFFRQHRTPGE